MKPLPDQKISFTRDTATYRRIGENLKYFGHQITFHDIGNVLNYIDPRGKTFQSLEQDFRTRILRCRLFLQCYIEIINELESVWEFHNTQNADEVYMTHHTKYSLNRPAQSLNSLWILFRRLAPNLINVVSISSGKIFKISSKTMWCISLHFRNE